MKWRQRDFSPTEWFFAVCPTPHSRKQKVLINKNISFQICVAMFSMNSATRALRLYM